MLRRSPFRWYMLCSILNSPHFREKTILSKQATFDLKTPSHCKLSKMFRQTDLKLWPFKGAGYLVKLALTLYNVLRWPWGTHLRLWVIQLSSARFNWAQLSSTTPAQFNCAQLGSTAPSSIQLSWALWTELSSVESSWARLNRAGRSWTELGPVNWEFWWSKDSESLKPIKIPRLKAWKEKVRMPIWNSPWFFIFGKRPLAISGD